MISFSAIFVILAIHWVADFVLQTHEQAMNKSSSNRALISHTSLYSFIWLKAAIIYAMFHGWDFDTKVLTVVGFGVITFVTHTVTDWFTSRWSKKFFSKQDYHNGFVVVGFDQILHYVQLFGCYIWLS